MKILITHINKSVLKSAFLCLLKKNLNFRKNCNFFLRFKTKKKSQH